MMTFDSWNGLIFHIINTEDCFYTWTEIVVHIQALPNVNHMKGLWNLTQLSTSGLAVISQTDWLVKLNSLFPIKEIMLMMQQSSGPDRNNEI